MDNRIPWPDYFMSIAYLVAERSTCLRRKVGALAVKDKRILATGYNGAPAGLTHCLDIGCLREKLGIPRDSDMNCAERCTPNRTSSSRLPSTGWASKAPTFSAPRSHASSARRCS